MIKGRFVAMGFWCLTLFALCFALGIGVCPWLLIPSAACMAGYIWIDRKYLRCPHCGGFLNVSQLEWARKREHHCMHCGGLIEIE